MTVQRQRMTQEEWEAADKAAWEQAAAKLDRGGWTRVECPGQWLSTRWVRGKVTVMLVRPFAILAWAPMELTDK